MRILVDIGHPAHVHLFKNIIVEMQKRGHVFFLTVRVGENETFLLDKLGLDYAVIGYRRKTIVHKITGLVFFTSQIIKIAQKFKPDIFLSHGSMYAGFASRFFGKPHIALEDSGNKEQMSLSLPVSDAIISPIVLQEDYGLKHIRYDGYHELMYLAPKYFIPDKSVGDLLSDNGQCNYSILRFVSWEASHDKGKMGLTLCQKRELVNHLLFKGIKVFISAERPLPSDLNSYKLNIPFDKIHDALAFATLYVGEGATMASEAGILGVPSFYVSPIRRCYNDDQEKYGTVYNFTSYSGLVEKIDGILQNPQAHANHKILAKNLINDKIDVNEFILWFIEYWPESFKIAKADPDYQSKFRSLSYG